MRYVVAAFSDAHWVRSTRPEPAALPSRGPRSDGVTLEELPFGPRGPVLRAFLEPVHGEVRFVGPRSVDDALAAAPNYTVFRIEALDPSRRHS